MPRLSPAGMATVIAGPAKAGPASRRTPHARPRRPSASWMVATPKAIRVRAVSAELAEDGMLLHQLERRLDMRTHAVGGEPDVACADGGSDLAMLALDLALLALHLDDDQTVPIGPVPQPIEDLDQRRVARRAVDGLVELAIG